ncbi:MAG: ABC transporter ATP-binding protein [Kiritimatiellae bacterium]|nr:ABC transporter ATP-binding protein [Kiritimatiellia bacterium]
MFEVRNIAFSYGSHTVLRDVSFVVSPGETVSIVGDNGAGKTTLLRVLATLMTPERGTVRVNGQDAFSRPLAYRSQLGYMQENPALYEDMTVKSFLRYRAQLKGEPAKRIRRRVSEAVDICRLGECIDSRIRALSLGLKKRVALADAMLLRPRVMLLDDLLAGLDFRMREAAERIVSTVAAFSSVIVTGHEIPDLAKWSTRILILRDGVIADSISSAGLDGSEFAARVDRALRGGAK